MPLSSSVVPILRICIASRKSAIKDTKFQSQGSHTEVLIITFRSRLTDQAGEDYQATNTEMEALVRQNPGFIDVKSYKSDDGERLTLVWWNDEESLREWREQVRHRAAQSTGRQKWYQYYKMEVAKVIRESSFQRS